MRGDLDDVRNQMARALAWGSVPPEALDSLVHGFEGIGIDLSGARAALGTDPKLKPRHDALGRDVECWIGVDAEATRGERGRKGGVEEETGAGRGRGREPCGVGAVVLGKNSVMCRTAGDHARFSGRDMKESDRSSNVIPKAAPGRRDGKRSRRKRSGGKRSGQR